MNMEPKGEGHQEAVQQTKHEKQEHNAVNSGIDAC